MRVPGFSGNANSLLRTLLKGLKRVVCTDDWKLCTDFLTLLIKGFDEAANEHYWISGDGTPEDMSLLDDFSRYVSILMTHLFSDCYTKEQDQLAVLQQLTEDCDVFGTTAKYLELTIKLSPAGRPGHATVAHIYRSLSYVLNAVGAKHRDLSASFTHVSQVLAKAAP
jgi:hypothetical protein